MEYADLVVMFFLEVFLQEEKSRLQGVNIAHTLSCLPPGCEVKEVITPVHLLWTRPLTWPCCWSKGSEVEGRNPPVPQGSVLSLLTGLPGWCLTQAVHQKHLGSLETPGHTQTVASPGSWTHQVPPRPRSTCCASSDGPSETSLSKRPTTPHQLGQSMAPLCSLPHMGAIRNAL